MIIGLVRFFLLINLFLYIFGNLAFNRQSGDFFLIAFYSSLHRSLQYCPVRLKMLAVNHDNSLNFPVDCCHDLVLTVEFKINIPALKKDNALS